MDKFQEMMQKAMQMPEEARMQMMGENKKACIRVACPSYTGTGETALLFCANMKSKRGRLVLLLQLNAT